MKNNMTILNRGGLFDPFFDDFFDLPIFRTREENHMLRADIKDEGDSYLIELDVPSIKKENIKIELEDGYLNVSVTSNNEVNEENKGKYLRQERYFGSYSRSFYVGEEVNSEDISAKLEDGVLSLSMKKAEKIVPEKKFISIQ